MSNLVDQPTATTIPRKVASGGVGGGIAVIVIALLNRYFDVDIDGDLASAITLVISSVFAYVTKESS